VVDGLIQQGDSLGLNPELLTWQDDLQKRRQQWFSVRSHNALSLYADILDCAPVQLLIQQSDISAQQYWIASPYHARMGRDAIRLMPESMLPWCEEDARYLCEFLNPWLRMKAWSYSIQVRHCGWLVIVFGM